MPGAVPPAQVPGNVSPAQVPGARLAAEGPDAVVPASGPGAGPAAGVPVTARSVVASILLPLERPALPARSLVRCCELFAINEGTTRVALSRMVAAGELQVEGGQYRLTGRMLERQARQRQARRPRRTAWDGRWLVAVAVVDRPRAGRMALRQAMEAHHVAELRGGAWARPDNLAGLVVELAADPHLGECLWWRAERAVDIDRTSPGVLAARLWDLDGWAAEAARLQAALARTLPALAAGDTTALAPCFAVAAATVRHITGDPVLPEPLLPADWPGAALRSQYDSYEAAYRRVLVDWIARDAGRRR